MANNDGTLKFDTKIDSSGFQKGLDSIGGVAQKGIAATTKIMGVAATGITALGGAAIKVGSDFEAGMSEVQAIVGTVADKDLPGIIDTAKEMGLSFKEGASTTETAMNILSEKAKEMGASTKFSATESAEALNYMAMAGWKTEEMLGGIEGIMNLAAASGEDLAMTSNIVTDALTAFGMTAADSTHFADILAAASSNANTNVSMMGETFKYVAPLAGSLGYSAEDIATAIGLMANAGIKGSQAGTSLRSIMTRLAKPTKESATAMNALGLSITDIKTGEMKSLSEIVVDMRKGFAGLTEDEKASYAAMLGGQEAMSGLLAIVNASDADFEKLSGAINDCNGSAAEMAEIMQDNLQGQITILQSGLEGLGVSLYETMQDTAKDVVKEAQGMVQQLQDAFNEGGFDGLVGSVGDVLAQIVQRIADAAPVVIEAAVSLVTSFCDGLKNAPGIGESGASLITSIVIGLQSCASEIWTTAIILIGKLAEGIAAGAPQMVQAASDTMLDIIGCIIDWMPDILQAGADIIVALAEGIADALPTLIYQAAVIVEEIATVLINNLPAFVDAALQIIDGLVQGFVDGAPALLEGAIQLFMAILEALPVVIEQLLQALPDIIITITDYLTENTPMIVDGAFQMLMGIIEAIPQIIEALVEATPEIVSAIVDSIVRQGAALVEAGSKIIGWLIEGASSVWGSITDWFAGAVQNLINSIVTFLEELPYKIGYAIGNIIGTLVDWNNSVNEWIVTEVPKIIDNIIEWFKGLPDRIAEWFNQTIDNLTPWGTSFKESSGQKVDEICIGIIEGFKELPDKLIEIGGNLISGLIEGIAGKTQDLWNSVTDFCGGIVDGFKDALGIHSPSTVMEEQAGYLVDGVINGIANMPAELAQYLDETVARVLAWGQQMLASAKTAVSNMISAIISQLAQLPGKVTAELAKVTAGMVQWGADIVSKMTEVGKNIVSGIWNGISSGWDWLTGKVAELANSLLESAKGALGINSPSTEFRDEFGRWLMPGAVEGVKRSMPRALQDMKEQAGELLAAMKGAVDTSMSEISMNAYGSMGARALTTAGTVVQIDNSQKQENNYHEKVISPSEVAKNQREAFRNFQKGVK